MCREIAPDIAVEERIAAFVAADEAAAVKEQQDGRVRLVMGIDVEPVPLLAAIGDVGDHRSTGPVKRPDRGPEPLARRPQPTGIDASPNTAPLADPRAPRAGGNRVPRPPPTTPSL